MTQYIYLFHTREFINAKQPIYKIRKTTKQNFTQFFEYQINAVAAVYHLLMQYYTVPVCRIICPIPGKSLNPFALGLRLVTTSKPGT